MKRSELLDIIKEEMNKLNEFASKSYILVSKSKNSTATIDDFKKIVAQIQSVLKKFPGLFDKYHAQYTTSNKNYEVELILNSDKIVDNYDAIETAIKKIKSPLFNIKLF